MTAKKYDFNTHLVTLVFGLLGSFAAFLCKDYYDRTWGADRADAVVARTYEHEQDRVMTRKLFESESKLLAYIDKNEQHWTDNEKMQNQQHESTMQAIGRAEHQVSTSGAPFQRRRFPREPADSSAVQKAGFIVLRN